MENLEMIDYWKNRRVLVTGATGLVGGSLVAKLLQLGAEIGIIVLEESNQSELIKSGNIHKCYVYRGDIRDQQFVKFVIVDFAPDDVFHLGAQTIVGKALIDPAATFESNIQGTWNLLEAIRIYCPAVKSVQVASSDKAYGSSKILPYDESFPLHGDGPYDVSKSCTDLIAQSYKVTFKLPITVGRCGNIYGPGDLNWSRIVPGTFKAIFSGEQPVLRSDGTYLRDYIHVDDVISAYLTLGQNALSIQGNGVYNFSTDKAYSVIDIYKEICLVTSGKFITPNILNSAVNEIHDQHLDSSKARRELGWSAQLTLESGLRMTRDWYEKTINDGNSIHE